ncbi:hypothetical protein PCE1_000019 [Barthelona sp. PCE]
MEKSPSFTLSRSRSSLRLLTKIPSSAALQAISDLQKSVAAVEEVPIDHNVKGEEEHEKAPKEGKNNEDEDIVQLRDRLLLKRQEFADSLLTEIEQTMEETFIQDFTNTEVCTDFINEVEDSALFVTKVPLKQAKEETIDIHKALEADLDLEGQEQYEWYLQYKERLEQAYTRVFEYKQQNFQQMVHQKEVQLNDMLNLLSALRNTFQKLESRMKQKFRKHYISLNEVSKSLFARNYTLIDSASPIIYKVSLHSLRETRTKMAAGKYCIHTTIINSLGGMPVVWSKLGVETLHLGSSGIYDYPTKHRHLIQHLDLERRATHCILPSHHSLPWTSACLLVQLLFLGEADDERSVIAWGVYPVCDSQLNILQGPFMMPMLRGHVDSTLRKWSQIEMAIKRDLEVWFGNFYFSLERIELEELPKCQGEIEHENNLKLDVPSNFFLSGGEKLNVVAELVDPPYKPEPSRFIEYPCLHDGKAKLHRPDEFMDEYEHMKTERDTYLRELTARSEKTDREEEPLLNGAIDTARDTFSPVSDANEIDLDDIIPGLARLGEDDKDLDEEGLAISSQRNRENIKPLLTPVAFNPDEGNILDTGVTLPRGLIPPFADLKKGFLKSMIRSERRELFNASKYGLITFITTILMFLLFMFLRPYIHGFIQIFYLYAMQFPYSYKFENFGITLIYQTSVITVPSVIMLVFAPLLISMIVFLLIVSFSVLATRLLKQLHPLVWRAELFFFLIILLDPVLEILYSIVNGQFAAMIQEFSTPSQVPIPIPDILKLLYFYHYREGNGLPGLLLTLLLYVIFYCLALPLIYWFFVHVYENKRVIDTFYRLSDPHHVIFCPPDNEVTISLIREVIDQARRYATREGLRRKTAGERYELVTDTIPPKIIASVAHIVVYNKHPLSRVADVHRRFAVVCREGSTFRARVFELDPTDEGTFSIPGLDSGFKLRKIHLGAPQLSVSMQPVDEDEDSDFALDFSSDEDDVVFEFNLNPDVKVSLEGETTNEQHQYEEDENGLRSILTPRNMSRFQ